MMHVFTLLGASFTLVMLLMLIFWLIYLFQRRACVIDIGWSLGFIVAAWSYFFLGNGDFLKMLTLTLMVTIWGGRLTMYLFQRYRANDREDPRYQDLLAKWDPDSASLFFLMLSIFQGVLIIIISMPFFLVSIGSNDVWTQAEVIGMTLWLVGVAGETFADRQLAAFHRDPLNKDAVYQKGLWRFSRHPNYFFEAIIWLGFALFAFSSSAGWLALISPVMILVLLFKISGIPLTEKHALQMKGEAYREYQRTTSAFVPWFPK